MATGGWCGYHHMHCIISTSYSRLWWATCTCSNYYQVLAVVLVGPPYPLLYSNYDEQQYDELLTIFDQLNGVDAPILMGQFCHGPLSPRERITPVLPLHYGMMNAGGFVSPYVLLDGRCTFCSDNPATRESALSGLADHEYLNKDSFEVSCEVCSYSNRLPCSC